MLAARIVAAQYAAPTKRARIAARHWQTAQRLTQSPVRDRLVKSARTATIAVREFALPHPTASAGARPRRVVGQAATCAFKTVTVVQTHVRRILRVSTAAPYQSPACQKASYAMGIISVAPTRARPSALQIQRALRRSAVSSMALLSSVYRMQLPVRWRVIVAADIVCRYPQVATSVPRAAYQRTSSARVGLIAVDPIRTV